MISVNSRSARPPRNLEYQFNEMTNEDKKAWYDSMYLPNGEIRPYEPDPNKKPINITTSCAQDGPTGNFPVAYGIVKVGEDDYAIFKLDPMAQFNGGKPLSIEQAAYLRSKYDMENLSKEDWIKLLAELSCFGVISGSEAYDAAFPDKNNSEKDSYDKLFSNDKKTNWQLLIEHYMYRMVLAKEEMRGLLSDKRANISVAEDARRRMTFCQNIADAIQMIVGKSSNN